MIETVYFEQNYAWIWQIIVEISVWEIKWLKLIEMFS